MGDSLKNLISNVYPTILPPWTNYLRRELQDCKTILDLGCGRNSPIQHIPHVSSVGVELFKPYLEENKSRGLHSEYILADVRQIEFKQNSFDAVLALELVEHLTKEEGVKLIEKMEKWASKKVIISTPNRFLPQDEYDNNPLQIHKSGWSVEEFQKLGFKVYGINGWKILKRDKARLKFKPASLWEKISDISQKVTYYFPKYAFQILCVKSLERANSAKSSQPLKAVSPAGQ